MESIYTLGTSSASHTYGNVAAFLQESLKQYFARNFITDIHMESTIAWRNMQRLFGNTSREFHKRQYPFMIITPNFIPNSGNDRYLANTPLTANLENAVGGLRRNTLFPLIMDQDKQIELAYKINRDQIEFEVELRLKTQAQQLDIYKNLYNQIMWDVPHLEKASLESMIPKSMIEYIGKLAGIDITQSSDTNNLVPLIMQYLNAHARAPITYKVRNSTSVDEFFMYYRTNLLITYSDLEKEARTKKNAVDEYCAIRFRIMVDFNLPGMYALVGNHDKRFHGLKFDAVVHSTDGVEVVPMFTYANIYNRIQGDTPDGFTFYSSTIIQSEMENRGTLEVVDLKDVIPEDHMRILDQFLADNVPPETLFRFRLLMNSTELLSNCDVAEACPYSWEVDWVRKQIRILHSDPEVTYRLIIYANLVQINERFAQNLNLGKKDREKL